MECSLISLSTVAVRNAVKKGDNMAECSCCGETLEKVNDDVCKDCLKIPDWFGCPTSDTPENIKEVI